MQTLHRGKKSQECKLSITESLDDYIKKLAIELRCPYADVARDFIYLGATGKTFSEHVANDRRNAMQVEVKEQDEKRADIRIVVGESIRTNPS
ncbi:MAG: hypothetical protein Q7U05_01105 [Polaromonas sp.]|nr:hypothetical protein [Polaromonas sp.]